MQTNIYKNAFVCPKCAAELEFADSAAKCANGHSYDKSRYGYYNLLLTNVGGIHGDNREMVLSRRAFLGAGYYSPLSKRLGELCSEYLASKGALLDSGCGEGYYTDSVECAMRQRDGESRVFAFDISKEAARECAKRNRNIKVAVASSYRMPVGDGSVDGVLNVFSPLSADETHRVLRDNGCFILAVPDSDHLYELKCALYDTPYKNKLQDSAIKGFALIHEERLRYTMHLADNAAVSSLFGMTPYAYRTGSADAQKIYSLQSLDCTADFHIFVYRKE